jgi:hypothetical protein
MGGAAGHMAHPFNLVQSGNELINLFVNTHKHLQNNPTHAAVKIDGLNVSVKLVKGSGGHAKEFAIDRGSNKPLDVLGVRKIDLCARFGKGHGLISKATVVLDILNSALPKIRQELVHLGMWDSSNLLLNMEYVAGKSNVQDYGCSFLAVHGLLEASYATENRRTTSEKVYASVTMQRLINKLDMVARNHGFKVVGSVGANSVGTPDFSAELKQTYSVRYSNERTVTKTLRGWLNSVKQVPHNKTLKLANNKKVEAMSKEVFVSLTQGAVLSQYLLPGQPKETTKNTVDGFVCYLATAKLGGRFLDSYTSELGNVGNQEGLVIRGLTTNPFKITGSFILRGMQSCFQK